MQTATLFTDVTCLWVFENYYDMQRATLFWKYYDMQTAFVLFFITDPTFLRI